MAASRRQRTRSIVELACNRSDASGWHLPVLGLQRPRRELQAAGHGSRSVQFIATAYVCNWQPPADGKQKLAAAGLDVGELAGIGVLSGLDGEARASFWLGRTVSATRRESSSWSSSCSCAATTARAATTSRPSLERAAEPFGRTARGRRLRAARYAFFLGSFAKVARACSAASIESAHVGFEPLHAPPHALKRQP